MKERREEQNGEWRVGSKEKNSRKERDNGKERRGKGEGGKEKRG